MASAQRVGKATHVQWVGGVLDKESEI
jgi:hypothetical protein